MSEPHRFTPPAAGLHDSSVWQQAIETAREGSREAQAMLLRAVRPYLLALAAGEVDSDLRPKVDASDVVQETMSRAWCGFADFRGNSRAQLLAWLRTILCHHAADARRPYRKTAKRDVSREVSLELLETQFGSGILADSDRSPSAHAMANERHDEVEHALRQLSSRDEQAVRLRNELGLSFAEMGIALDCSADAARKRWARAVEILGEKLRDHGTQ